MQISWWILSSRDVNALQRTFLRPKKSAEIPAVNAPINPPSRTDPASKPS